MSVVTSEGTRFLPDLRLFAEIFDLATGRRWSANRPPPSSGANAAPPERPRRSPLQFLAVLVIAAPLVFAIGDSCAVHTVTTDIGERRSVDLDRNTTALLNTNTRIRWWPDGSLRVVEILQGEALFTSRGRERKHLSVLAGNMSLIDIGTTFAARIVNEAEVQVTVAQGEVFVSGDNMTGAVIHTGQVASLNYRHPRGRLRLERYSKAEIRGLLSWQDGILTFRCPTIGEASQEFARYNRVRIIPDARASREVIGGQFVATKPSAFAAAVVRVYPYIHSELDDSDPGHPALRLISSPQDRQHNTTHRPLGTQCTSRSDDYSQQITEEQGRAMTPGDAR